MAEMAPVKRRLMAILAADAVGYSRMMGEDEVRTIRVLTGHREVIDALIANYGARIVGTAGDSVLAEFGSAVDAVRCATEIQDAVRERNEKLPEHERMWFRIGVNLGDVIVSEADVHGDGVNVAVRLESIAEPGGVCISSSVYDQISGKLNLGFTDIGEQNLKNIARPIRAYRFAGPVPPILPKPMKHQARRGGVRRWAWGLAALALVAVAGAWQAGWLPHADGDAETAKAEAARIEASRAQQERRGDAERARMEAELARARADAEAAKKQAEAQSAAAADARRSLETQRAAEAKARAQAELAQARAEAEAIKRDAQAQSFAATRAREQAEASAAQAKAREEAAAKAAAEAQARQAAAEKAQREAVAKTQQAAPAKAVASAESRHDGTWVALHACHATRRAPEVKARFPANISEGMVRVRNGRPGENGYAAFDGRIAADGSLALRGVLIPGRADLGREERPVHYEGRLEGDRFMLKGEVGRRPCTLALSRLAS